MASFAELLDLDKDQIEIEVLLAKGIDNGDLNKEHIISTPGPICIASWVEDIVANREETYEVVS